MPPKSPKKSKQPHGSHNSSSSAAQTRNNPQSEAARYRETPSRPAESRGKLVGTGVWIVAVALLHMLVSGHAASTKSATFDEPVHTLAGILQWRFDDYRLNPEHPPLWKLVAGMATTGLACSPDLQSTASQAMLANLNQQERWVIESLFRDPQHDGTQLVDRARLGMLLFGGVVVCLVGLWARQLAGGLAGGLAATMAALDPNLIGHSGLVTNDVACTAALLACFYFAWRVTQRATLANVFGFAVSCGLAAVTKFTALALPLMLAPVVAMRCLDSTVWQSAFGDLTGLRSRLVAVSAIVLLTALTAWALIWAAYGFRYRPTPDSQLTFDTSFPGRLYAHNVMLREHQRSTNPEAAKPESYTVELNAIQDLCLWAHEYRILPQPFIHGIAYAQAMSTASQSFVDGQRVMGGSWSFFPRAWSYKTPLAVIVAVLLTCGWGLWSLLRRWRSASWLSMLCLPYCVVILLAVSYDLNIGLRHLLPALPLMWIGLGLAGAAAINSKSRWRHGVWFLVGLAAIETLAYHPHYIAFFNWVARGKNQGLERLSDSNLDWGQDLKLLAEWQRAHPDVPLYLSYFGSADPAAYGIRYINTAPGYLYGSPTTQPDYSGSGVLAYSATWLQAAYVPASPLQREMDMLRRQAKPTEVLGGTIYLYRLPLSWQDGQ
ncbi:MAG: hypothetical protein KF752_19330 [Pirellulaceae bacterium]|nr:hypothetical protein [Pirellulaceae bacterium]